MISHMVSRNIPNSEQHTLPLMVARAVLMGLAEVAKGYGSVDGRNYVGQANVAWGFG
jgi:hypothetical protein